MASQEWKKLEFVTGMSLAPYPILKHPAAHLLNGYYSGVDRQLTQGGYNVDYLACEFHAFFRAIVDDIHPEWVATTTCPRDAAGDYNLGVTGDLTEWFIQHKIAGGWDAKILVEVNDNMPHVIGFPELGNHVVNVKDVDVVVTGAESRPIPEYPKVEPTAEDRQIADHVEEIVRDGATIQIGIGRLPDAIGDALKGKRNLGIHTEMLTNCVKGLVESGAVTGAAKHIHHPLYEMYNDKVVFTFIGGNRALYDFVDQNPAARCVPLNHLNDEGIIRLNHKVTCINAILACDLRGQTTSSAFCDGETATQYTGIGGQATFVRAAQETTGGCSIQCVPSVRDVNGELMSNIIAALPAGTPIGTPEYSADYIVTEYGAARLRGLGMRDRAKVLVKIAHPDFQDQIIAEATKRGMM
jgi:4-hydroxybutyrate CoA-transferase